MRYLIGLLIAIVVIIYIIIRLLSSGGGSAVVPQKTLTDYADTDVQMRMIIENPVQSPQTHRDVEITVGRDTAELTIYKGYDTAQVVTDKVYAMNEAAYSDFLHGLLINGHYTSGNTNPKLRSESGYCAIGDRYVYEIVDGAGNVSQHFWSTSCGVKTFNGNVDVVQQLFKNEIPDYGTLIQNVQF